MKLLYINLIYFLRLILRAVGVINVLDKLAKKSDLFLWIRSLLSIYDLSDLIALDLPWWTFQSKEIVDKFLQTRINARVFEFGSGSSTFWLAKRAAEVISIEHDSTWAKRLNLTLPPNAKVILVEGQTISTDQVPILSRKKGFENLDFTNYVQSIDKQIGVFDVIVIDGRAREKCFEKALDFLQPDGIIVFDNVERARYSTVINNYKSSLEVQITRGLTPGLPYTSRTALVKKR